MERLRNQQIKYIDEGFGEVIRRLEEKREQLKVDFGAKYDKEAGKFTKKMELLDLFQNDINNIETTYDDLSNFVDRSSHAKVLTKIRHVSDFIQKSIENMEQISKAPGFENADTQIDPLLKPLSLHVSKIVNLITKFNMLPQNVNIGSTKTTSASGTSLAN